MKSKILQLSIFLFSMCCSQFMNAAEYTVSSDSDLEALLPLAAGDIVTWANGTYTDQAITVFGEGTASNPVIIKAETEGGVIFTGESPANIYGSYVEMEGFYWEGGSGTSDHVSFRRSGSDTDLATNCTLRNCGFNNLASEGDTKSRWIVLYGTQNVIENCSFVNKMSTGAAILVELRFQELQADQTCQHQIRNNYFYNITAKDGRENSGDCEAIRIGVSTNQAVNANCTVEGNYFHAADGENEIITNKSANNVFKNNTFRNCRGSLVMRHGSGAWVEGNFFLGEGKANSGGIRISDSFHTIVNNYFQDLSNDGDQWNNAITLVAGGESTGGTGNGYQNVDDVLIAFNTVYNCDDPLYFNDRSSYYPTGVIANNLFHSASTNAVMGEISTVGSVVEYFGNIGDASALGVSDNGLTAESISFVAHGEIFKPVSTSAVADAAVGDYSTITTDLEGSSRPSSNKDVGAHEVSGATSTGTLVPITNNEVGTSVGCCFIDASGTTVSGGCNIVIGPSLSVNPSTLSFDYEISNIEVSVLANVDWSVTENESWISLSATSGTDNGSFNVVVTENTTGVSRTGTITVTSNDGTISKDIIVNQEPFIAIIETVSDVSFNIEEGNSTVSVTSNVDWTISGDDTWFSFSPESGNGDEDITITVTENTTGVSRTGTITITETNGNESATVSITQSETSFNEADAEGLTVIEVIGVGTQEGDASVTADNVNDDIETTRWSGESNDGSAYLTLDVECPRILTAVQIYFHKGGERTSNFSIELSSDGINFTEVIAETTSEQVTGYQDFSLPSNSVAQYVKVKGYGNSVNNWNSYEEIKIYGDNSASACTVTGINDPEAGFQLSVFPNPVKDSFTFSGVENGSYELFDNTGSIYIQDEFNSGNSSVDASNLSSGIYYLKVISNGSTGIEKVLVD